MQRESSFWKWEMWLMRAVAFHRALCATHIPMDQVEGTSTFQVKAIDVMVLHTESHGGLRHLSDRSRSMRLGWVPVSSTLLNSMQMGSAHSQWTYALSSRSSAVLNNAWLWGLCPIAINALHLTCWILIRRALEGQKYVSQGDNPVKMQSSASWTVSILPWLSSTYDNPWLCRFSSDQPNQHDCTVPRTLGGSSEWNVLTEGGMTRPHSFVKQKQSVGVLYFMR